MSNVNTYLGIGQVRIIEKEEEEEEESRKGRGGGVWGREGGGKVVSIFSLVEGKDHIATMYFEV